MAGLLFASVLLLAAQFLLGSDASADSIWNWQEWLGTGILSCLCIFLVLGAGLEAARLLKLPEFLAPALGSAIFAFAASLFAQLGLIGQAYAWLFSFGLVAALGWQKLPRVKTPLLFLPLLALLPLALMIQDHPDPLYYHLLGQRDWYEAGSIFLNPDRPSNFLSGSWDFLYLWPLQLMAPGTGAGLLSQHIAAQLLHLVLGFGGSLAILHGYLKKHSLPAPLLAATLLLGLAAFMDSAIAAKNDWGFLLWALAALYLWDENTIVAGLLAGFALSVKWTASLSLLPIALLVLAKTPRQSYRHCGRFFLAAIAASLPALFRNWRATGDAFFPVFSFGAENSILSYTDKVLYQSFAAAKVRPELIENLFTFVLDQPLVLGLGFLPLVWKKLTRDTRIFVLASLVLFAFGLVVKHQALSWRIFGFTSLACALSAWMFTKYFWQERCKVPLLVVNLVWWLLLLVPLYQTQNFAVQPAALARATPGGDAMAWVRLNAKPEDKIALGGNAGLYYLDGYEAIYLEGGQALDARYLGSKSMKGLVLKLREENIAWFLETAGEMPRGLYARYFAELAKRYPGQGLSFAGSSGRAWNLQSLEKLVTHSAFSDFETSLPQFRILPQR